MQFCSISTAKNISNLVVSLPWKTCVACENYSKFRQTGSGHVTNSKLSYTIRFFILMLCADIRKLVCMVPEKNVTKIFLCNAYIKIILSYGKQEVDKPQIRNCLTQYNSIYLCSVLNIRNLGCMVPEKNVTEIFLYYTYSKIILSSGKQEVDKRQIQNSVTPYSSIY